MKLIKIAIVAIILAFTLQISHAQGTISTQGILTAADTVCTTIGACVTVQTVNGSSGTAIQIWGTFAGTASFEASVNGTDWVAINGVPVASATPASSTTAAGIWGFKTTGILWIRVRCSSYTSGRIQVMIVSSTGSY